MPTPTAQPVDLTRTLASVHVSTATVAADGSIRCMWTGLDAAGQILMRQPAAFTADAAKALLAGPASALLSALEASIGATLVHTKQAPPDQLPSPARAEALAASRAIAAGAAKAIKEAL